MATESVVLDRCGVYAFMVMLISQLVCILVQLFCLKFKQLKFVMLFNGWSLCFIMIWRLKSIVEFCIWKDAVKFYLQRPMALR